MLNESFEGSANHKICTKKPPPPPAIATWSRCWCFGSSSELSGGSIPSATSGNSDWASTTKKKAIVQEGRLRLGQFSGLRVAPEFFFFFISIIVDSTLGKISVPIVSHKQGLQGGDFDRESLPLADGFGRDSDKRSSYREFMQCRSMAMGISTWENIFLIGRQHKKQTQASMPITVRMAGHFILQQGLWAVTCKYGSS